MPIIIPDSPFVWLFVAAVLALGVGIAVYQWIRPPTWKKLLQDDRYRQALNVYAETVRQDGTLCDVRRKVSSK